MARCRVDPSIKRVTMDQFDFPLGCYPVEDVHPVEGFTLHFEPADGGPPGQEGAGDAGGDAPGGAPSAPGEPEREGREERDGGDWEEWPDRYVWDVLVKASRIDALLRALYNLMPGRAFPILDVLGNDAYREIDPYVAYELVGIERFLDATRRFRGYLMEDGFVGFGVMSEEPFLYLFVDEHKVVTIRAETALKERIEQVLAAFDLKQVEQIAGSDSAVHEHRGVLDAPGDRPDLLTAEEIVEELRDVWGLELNVDPNRNLDEQGHELGITGWRCVVRLVRPDGMVRYLEACLTAGSLTEAHDLAVFAAESEEDRQREAEGEGEQTRAGTPGKPSAPMAPPSQSPPAATGSGAPPSPTRQRASPGPSGALRRGGQRGGDGPGEAAEADADDEDDGLTTVDVVVNDRLTPEQLPELARELAAKGVKPTTKQARVWATRWGD